MASYAAITAIGQPVYAADLEAEIVQQQQQQQQQQQPQAPKEKPEESEHFLDCLDEVHTRFILNVPQEELSTSERIFFQLEQAWWYYEDLICDKLEQETGVCNLPRFANLKPFSKRLFEFSPLLQHLDFQKLWKEFAIYKRKISTYGCILLNKACTHVAMCQMYKSNTWTFPAGKINQNEIGVEAAAREVYEETGFDPHCQLGGLTQEWLKNGETEKIQWNYPLRDPEDAVTFVEQPSGKRRTCYICHGVPEDFPFAPVCRKEVDAIEWVDLNEIKEYKTFAVLPFIGKLRKWIKRRKNKNKKKERKNNKSRQKSRDKSRPKSSGRDASSGRDRSNQKSRRRNSKALVDSGLIASMGDSTRWTEEEMFATNSKLQGGRIVEYDGNPHAFAEKGFGVDDEATGSQRIDPHSFRVVGGSFMNSTHGDKLAEASNPEQMAAKYQPLVRENADDGSKLQPFFSQHGVTPWGETVNEAKSDEGDFEHLVRDDSEFDGYDEFAQESPAKSKKKSAGENLLAMLQTDIHNSKSQEPPTGPVSGDYNYDDDGGMMIFATDKEITAKKQKDFAMQKKQQQQQSASATRKGSNSRQEARRKKKEQLMAQYDADMAFVQNWVNNLPNPVNFQIPNVDAIIDQHYGKGAASRAAAAAAARQQAA